MIVCSIKVGMNGVYKNRSMRKILSKTFIFRFDFYFEPSHCITKSQTKNKQNIHMKTTPTKMKKERKMIVITAYIRTSRHWER